MRPRTLLALGLVWGLASPALAQDEEPEGTETAPAEEEVDSELTVPEAPETEAAPGPEEQVEQIQVDAIIPTAQRERGLWQVQGLYELHMNLVTDDRSAADWLSYYMLRGDLNVTTHDQLSLRLDLEQRYIADPDESGLYFGDMRFYYSRFFALPVPGFPIPAKALFYLTAPTSRSSQERSYITKPTAALTLAPSWGPLTLIAQPFFQYAFARYAESSHRGDPNTQITTGFTLQLFYTVFDWFSPSVAWQSTWSLPYQTREGDGQVWQREYYFEAALNFSVPMPEQAPSLDLSLAYAQGANVIEDGVYRLYFTKRDQSELYFALNLTY